MNTYVLAPVVMVALGAGPAALALAPQAPGPVAIVAAPWAPSDAAWNAALQTGAPILSVTSDRRGVVVLAPSTAVLRDVSLAHGLIALRGDAIGCSETRSNPFEARAP